MGHSDTMPSRRASPQKKVHDRRRRGGGGRPPGMELIDRLRAWTHHRQRLGASAAPDALTALRAMSSASTARTRPRRWPWPRVRMASPATPSAGWRASASHCGSLRCAPRPSWSPGPTPHAWPRPSSTSLRAEQFRYVASHVWAPELPAALAEEPLADERRVHAALVALAGDCLRAFGPARVADFA
jgi:hypothetical protein